MTSLQNGFFLVVLLLSGCASWQPAGPATHRLPWSTRVSQLSHLHSWRLESAFSFQRGQKLTLASLDWHQRHLRYDISLSGPLNFGKIDLAGKPGYVTLRKSADEVYSAKSPEALMQAQLGWSLPVSNMRYWIRGLPAPYYPAQRSFDTYNHLIRLKQQGWSIRYTEYQSIQGIDLPRKMFLQNQKIRVKLVIRHWNLYL